MEHISTPPPLESESTSSSFPASAPISRKRKAQEFNGLAADNAKTASMQPSTSHSPFISSNGNSSNGTNSKLGAAVSGSGAASSSISFRLSSRMTDGSLSNPSANSSAQPSTTLGDNYLNRATLVHQQEADHREVNENDDMISLNAMKLLEADAAGDLQSSASSTLIIPVPSKSGQSTTSVTESRLRSVHSLRESLPEATSSGYDRVRVEDFGAAILRGMGWKGEWKNGEGETDIKKSKEKGYEFIPQYKADKKGLGVKPSASLTPASSSSSTQANSSPAVSTTSSSAVSSSSSNSTSTWVLGVSDSTVRERALAEMIRSGKVINQFKQIPSLTTNTTSTTQQLAKPVTSSSSASASSLTSSSQAALSQSTSIGSISSSASSSSSSSLSSNSPSISTSAPLICSLGSAQLKSDIRLRVISSKIDSGRYFKEKGTIVEVRSFGPNGIVCLKMDGTGSLVDMPLVHLETVIPRPPNGMILVLRGPNAGRIGKVLERNTKKAKAAVQMIDDLSLIPFDFDDISEYCGEDAVGDDETKE